MNDEQVFRSASFLAEYADELFAEGFAFDKSDSRLKRFMQYFVWIDNVLYCTFFEKPYFVMCFFPTPAGIKIATISNLMALTWGLIMKREIE